MGRALRHARLISLLLVLALVASACSDDDTGNEASPTTAASPTRGGGLALAGTIGLAGESGGQPLRVRLSQGQPLVAAVPAPTQVVAGKPLTEAATQALLDRVPELEQDTEDTREFSRPAESLDPPRTGTTVDVAFGAGDDPPPTVDDGSLEVVRFQPDGDVPIAPSVSITFNQPMVPIGTLAQLDASDSPATIIPAVAGAWQWIGTRTLRFEADPELYDRLPMATSYRVTIPAGTRSAAGNELADDESWSFSTPPANATNLFPNNHQDLALDTVFVSTFDQTIDPSEVLGVTKLTADGESLELRLATDQELEDSQAGRIVGRTPVGRTVAFRAVAELPRDAAIRVEIGPRIPSAEGPRVGSNSTTATNRTYGPLRVTDASCNSDRCRPHDWLNVHFTNALDTESFSPEQVTIDPAVPGAFVSLQHNTISIRGATVGQTTYDVTLSAGLRDIYGQTLGANITESFHVGSADPIFVGPGRELVTLDPLADRPLISFQAINNDYVDLTVYDVEPTDWLEFRTWSNEYYNALHDDDRRLPQAPWTALVERRVDLDSERDALVERSIDLSDAVSDAQRHVVIIAEPQHMGRDNWASRPIVFWAQWTSLGLDVVNDETGAVLWSTDLRDGSPVPDAEVSFFEAEPLRTQSKGTHVTGDEGVVQVDLPSSANLAIVSKGNDSAVLPHGRWRQGSKQDSLVWYVIDDRGMYRPGETVRVKGWVRNLRNATDGQLALANDVTSRGWTVMDARGNEIATGSTDIGALGGFDLEIEIPDGANLGFATLSIGGTAHSFQIQEFRRPEFEVSARVESPGPHLVTEGATVATEANYFAGGPLPDAEVEWVVTTRPAGYSPPGWSDFVFGTWTPWWWREDVGAGDSYDSDIFFPEPQPGTVETFSGRTDAAGAHYLRIDLESDDGGFEPEPVTVSASSTVFDVNRQAWSAATDLLVHPAEVYIGLRSERSFVRPGETLTIDAIATTIDGDVEAGRPMLVELDRLEWTYKDGTWQEIAVDTTSCDLVSATKSVSCDFTPTVGGRYEVRATVADEDGRRNRTTMSRWVSGGTARPTRRVEQEQITIIPDKETYAPGDTAELLVQAPFSPAEGLMTITRNGIESTETFRIDGDSTILTIEIEDDHIPNLGVQIDLAGSTPRTGADGSELASVPPRPAFAVGSLDLSIPPLTRTLDVAVEPRDAATEPGAITSVDVTVIDSGGRPVDGAELAVIVVDEAVLALSNYQLRDPLEVFYPPQRTHLRSVYSRNSIVLADPDALLDQGGESVRLTARNADFDEYATEDDGDSAALAPEAGSAAADGPTVRTNFDALAVFVPEVTTDDDGKATVRVPLPDNLTRYRVMAVAVDGADNFGSGESNITARLPLMVRPSLPRFLNFGDSAELPVVIQNQTDAPLQVDVALAATNLDLSLGASAGRRIDVPANDRVEVRFPADTTTAGTARFQVVASGGTLFDAAAGSLPVYTPATAEAFATYGVIDSGATIQPILAPENVYPQFGGLEVNTSSTALQALTDALLYLSDYRYESSDAFASRILAITALDDVLQAFEADGLPSPTELRATVQRDIDRLVGLQNNDGGFPAWRRGAQSSPWHSVQATHALAVANDERYDVPADALQRALDHLRTIESTYPQWYGEHARYTTSAYAVYVRHVAGDSDVTKAQSLWNRYGDLSLEAAARIWMVIGSPSTTGREIERLVANRAVEQAGSATFSTNVSDDGWVILHSNHRTDAIVLEALIDQDPGSDLIPKVVSGLLGNQTNGRWRNVQENTFVLLTMRRYFDTFEAETPDFVARIWLGDLYAAEHPYRGRTTDRAETGVTTAELIEQGDSDLVIDKDGDGRLYYRLGLRYAPTDLRLDPIDRGFVVQRTYEAVDDPDDVVRNADGSWTIAAGTEVRVRVTMVADSRRTNMALIDPLPAGLEPVNPALSVSVEPQGDPASREASYWRWTWFDHQQMRDDRAEAFSSWLWAGTHEYTYVARATTPGTFVAPPARAEEIYAPEVFGRSSTDLVTIR